MTLEELREEISAIDTDDYNVEDTYCALRNAIIDYGNDTQDWEFEDFFHDIFDEELMWEYVHNMADDRDSVRNIYDFLKDSCADTASIWRFDAWGCAVPIEEHDLEEMKNNILERINDRLSQ